MKYIRPNILKKGDTIGFIAPAGAINDKESIERAKEYFTSEGYNVVYSEHLFNRRNYMSDIDENRLADLHWAFSNSDIDAIICARGGYGCLRLVDKIDYNLIKNNPKLFCGYSDITVLSAAFLKKAGLITYSGAMARGDFGQEEVSKFTIDNFYNAVTKYERLDFKGEKVYKKGNAQGITFGGNLASVVSMCGTDFLPDDKFIFFAEDLNEPVYKIDKMFTQLFNIKNFRENITGLILGDFLDSGYPEQLDELFYDIGDKYNIPVIGGYKITHNKEKITVPYGEQAIIDGDMLIIR
ncbi:LD-carboxypeptidase [bacterium]|nr:LD-carboxypeptidase [bacterium]